jgi:trimethylamine-N-oxide reductase (cytochrome c)
VRTETCGYMGAEWIAPRPQTDVALMLGIAHTLYSEKLHNEKFLKDYTSGFDRFVPYLLGQDDNTPKTAEWAAGICDVSAATIRDLARRFASNRTMLAAGWSMQRQQHGEQAHWMLVTLASMLGQIGLPGGGFGLSYHYASGGTPSATAPVLGRSTDGGQAVKGAAWLTKSGAASIPVARMVDMLMKPGQEFDFNGTKATYPDIKMIYWVGGNPFVHHQQRNRMVEAWHKVETFVVHDFQWDAVGDYSSRYILAMKKVIGRRRRGTPISCCRRPRRMNGMISIRCSRHAAITTSSPRSPSGSARVRRSPRARVRWIGFACSTMRR